MEEVTGMATDYNWTLLLGAVLSLARGAMLHVVAIFMGRRDTGCLELANVLSVQPKEAKSILRSDGAAAEPKTAKLD
jgi:hypothetical protein